MNNLLLTDLLARCQFWMLELLFVAVVVATVVELRRLPVRRGSITAGLALGAAAWVMTATVPPRTNRIFYDEHIYQEVARNLSDLHRAQMCNDGSVDTGRLQCFRGEYNKEPYGYPYLLSILFRAGGVNEAWAFRFNNLAAGLAVLVAVLLADLLFQDTAIAMLAGLVLALLPMQLTWSATAASEPAAALFTGAAMLAAIHFAGARTRSSLLWLIAVSSFAATIRPECLLVFPLAGTAVLLQSRDVRWLRTYWWAAGVWLVAALPALAHAVAVRNNAWDAREGAVAWRFAAINFAPNFWFYLRDERFPALIGIAALLGVVAWKSDSSDTSDTWRRRAFLLLYFLAFWLTYLFFYAGSYNWGANVRYSLMTYLPVAILAAAGLTAVARRLARGRASPRAITAATAAVVLVQFLWYLPLVRAVGEEAWAARGDVAFARAFAAKLPPHAIVLTHNPGMFHVWNTSAAQLSIVSDTPEYVDQYLARYTGGVYVHWNFWCNIPDKVQNAFCRNALERVPNDLIERHQERTYQFAFYRIRRP